MEEKVGIKFGNCTLSSEYLFMGDGHFVLHTLGPKRAAGSSNRSIKVLLQSRGQINQGA